MTFRAELPSSGPSSPGDGQPRRSQALEIKTGPQFRLRVIWPRAAELRCPKCGDWFAITPEFWHLNQWSECRTCHSARQALSDWIRRREDAGYRRKERDRSRRYREAVAQEVPHLLETFDREHRAAQAARLRRWRAARRAAA